MSKLSSCLASSTQLEQHLHAPHGLHHCAHPRPHLRRHSISLYANICSIKWDYDSKDIAGRECRGHGMASTRRASNQPAIPIPPTDVMPEGRPVKAFSIPAGSLDDTALANALWATIAQASGVDLSPA